jgi:hypothetical protein
LKNPRSSLEAIKSLHHNARLICRNAILSGLSARIFRMDNDRRAPLSRSCENKLMRRRCQRTVRVQHIALGVCLSNSCTPTSPWIRFEQIVNCTTPANDRNFCKPLIVAYSDSHLFCSQQSDLPVRIWLPTLRFTRPWARPMTSLSNRPRQLLRFSHGLDKPTTSCLHRKRMPRNLESPRSPGSCLNQSLHLSLTSC